MQTLKSTGCVLDARAAPGNVFVDVSRYHHNITNNNAVTVKGMGSSLGGGYNGATSYLDCGNHPSFNITDVITIEAWVKPNQITSMGILSKGDNYDLNFGFGGTKFRMRINNISFDSTIAHGYIANTWHYITTIVNGNDNTINFYSDGIKLGSTVTLTEILTVNVVYLLIGGGDEGFYTGTISSARIYNRALPAYEILDHYYEYATLLGLD